MRLEGKPLRIIIVCFIVSATHTLKYCKRMSTQQTYSPQYLAESRTTLLNVFYSIPIALVIFSTGLRLWSVTTRIEYARIFGFDDYLMIWATVRSHAPIYR